MAKRPQARIYRGSARNIAFLARTLRAGEIVAVPTETVYGLAGNAFDAQACAKIFRAKGRPSEDPLIVHVHALAQLDEICVLSPAARKLARKFWPGPLTLVLPKKPAIPDIVTAGRDSVAVRMPSHRLFRRLLRTAGVPLAAPSANRFGYISPTTAAHVADGLGGKIGHILDGGAAKIGLESTIVDLRDPRRIALLRPGLISVEEISRVLRQRVRSPRATKQNQSRGQIAPGLLARHYSPRTALVLHQTLERSKRRTEEEAYVFLRRPDGPREKNVFWLDARGNLNGVAHRLFAVLRRLDAMGFKRIHVELAPGSGIAEAINDRLRRAAAR